MSKKKLVERTRLAGIVAAEKRKGRKTVFTNGCFDILHRGHVELLEKAKKFGDILIVAINTDNSVKKLKGPKRPINTMKDRARTLAGLESVDYVTWFPERDPATIIKTLRPDVLIKGGDWKIYQIVGRKFIEDCGGKVATIPFV